LKPFSEGLRRLLPGVWLGVLVAIALIAAPAASGALDKGAFGAVARAIFAREAPTSFVFGVLILVIERRDALARHLASGTSQFSTEMTLAIAALFCTVAGYYGLLPMMEQARSGGATPLTFLQLHAISLAFFGVKGLVVLGLAWKAVR
jgi:ABC-type multidrug transport system permease subunit